jgi:hypothetical protein
MIGSMTPFEPKVLTSIEGYRNHAQDLYRAAAVLKEQSLPNVGWFVAYGSLCQAEDQNRLSKPTRTCSIAATAVDARHRRCRLL